MMSDSEKNLQMTNLTNVVEEEEITVKKLNSLALRRQLVRRNSC